MELTRPAVPQSTFVTVLAWIFIVLAGFATLISLLQNVMINTVFPVDELQSASHSSASNDAPAAAMFLASHVKLFFAAFLVVTASTLVAAAGLLRRRNWARLAFVGILLLGISWNVVALVAQQFFFASMPVVPPDAPPHFRAESQAMEGFFMVMRVVSVVMAVGFSVLFGWLVKRLLSASVAAEFANGA
jgi:hypothetical protein